MVSLIRTLILEDEPHWQLVLRRMAESHPMLEVIGIYGSPLEALPAIANQKPDLILLDVEFAEINGFAFAKSLDNPPLIIFVTTHSKFAVQSYEVEAVDFLVKPVMIDRFIKAIDKVHRRLELREQPAEVIVEQNNGLKNNFFFIKDQQGYVKVRYDEILFIRSMENYVQIVTATHSFMTLAALQHVEARLGSDFMRVHRSYIVNLDKIEQFNNEIIQIGTHEIPLGGGQYQDQFKQDFVYRNLLKR
jgi:DNA-binding LytR/AlgR family response regulator